MDRPVRLHNLKPAWFLFVACLLMFHLGCGTTKQKTGTDQLLMSNAVDLTVGDLDFSSITGEKVYLDTQYVVSGEIRGVGYVGSHYIISSLRQQLIAHSCQLIDSRGDADYVVEARVGALGNDSQTITYGIPGNSSLGNVSALFPNMPTLPVIPEISIAKRDDNAGIAKISVFIYDAKNGDPIWQSGVEYARSTANDMWVFGAGPFQWGTIYGSTHFAGNPIRLDNFNVAKWLRPKTEPIDVDHAIYFNEFSFGTETESNSLVLPASYNQPATSAPPDQPESGEPKLLIPAEGARKLPR